MKGLVIGRRPWVNFWVLHLHVLFGQIRHRSLLFFLP